MQSYEHEVETWYALYMTYNDDNQNHADFAFMAAGFQSAEEVHRANLNWLSEIFQRIDYTAENIAEMELLIPHAKELLREYQSAEERKPSIRAQLAAATQTREKRQMQLLTGALDRSMKAYRLEWSTASPEYLVADAAFICAVEQTYKYLMDTHRFTPEEVDTLLRMKSPLQEVAVKWRERMVDLSDFPFALDAAIKEKREAYRHELEVR